MNTELRKTATYIQLISAIENTRTETRLAAIVNSFFQSDQRRETHGKLQTARQSLLHCFTSRIHASVSQGQRYQIEILLKAGQDNKEKTRQLKVWCGLAQSAGN